MTHFKTSCAYLRALATEHDKGIDLLRTSPRYAGHPVGLNFEQRSQLKKILIQRCLPLAEAAGINDLQHAQWASQVVDFCYAASTAAVAAALSAGKDNPEKLEQEILYYLRQKNSAAARSIGELFRCNPMSGMTTLYAVLKFTDPASAANEAARKRGAVPNGWLLMLCSEVGFAFDHVAELRKSINTRFRGGQNRARVLLLSLAEETERMLSECAHLGASLAFTCHGDVAPSLIYWPMYPNSGVACADVRQAVEELSFPLMLEIMPDLIKKRNIQGKEVSIPTHVHLGELFGCVQTIGSICQVLSEALKDGRTSRPLGQKENLTPKVSIFARPEESLEGQARVAFQVKTGGSYAAAVSVRFDLERGPSHSRLSIDLGSCDLSSGISYALESHKLAKKPYSSMVDCNGELIYEGKTAKASSSLKPLDDLVDINTRLGIVGACLSNMGSMISLREREVVSHHRREHSKSNYTPQEFRKAVEDLWGGLSDK